MSDYSVADLTFRKFLAACYNAFQLKRSDVPEVEFDVLAMEVQFLWDKITLPEKALITLEQIKDNQFEVLVDKMPDWVLAESTLTYPQIQRYRRRVWAGVGSRDTPAAILVMMSDIGEALTNDGWFFTSGDADGADLAFYEGVIRSPRHVQCVPKVYLPWNPMRYTARERRADNIHFFDATKFENYETARDIAFNARGSFEGLGRGGIGMHTRNAYQVLQDDLQTPVDQIVCWAKPVGKKGNVSGGTNTAHRIGLDHGIDIINLATEAGFNRAAAYLAKKGNSRYVELGFSALHAGDA